MASAFSLVCLLLALFERRQKPEMNVSNYLGIVRSKVLNVVNKINRINLQGVFCQIMSIVINVYVCHMLSRFTSPLLWLCLILVF